jgi:hypothetical protein
MKRGRRMDNFMVVKKLWRDKNDYIFCGNLRKECEILGILGYSTNF